MKSPIKYFGGKGGLYTKIIDFFPEEPYKTYIEPFAGSYIVGLQKPIAQIEIYNDLNQNVYSLYKVLSDKDLFLEFKEKCDLVFYSEDLRKEFKENLKKDLSIVDRAFYFFYINRSSHNGIGGFSINKNVVRRSMSKSVSDFLSAIDRLPELHDRLSRVIVTNRDGIGLINDNSNTDCLIYCDPPYEQSTRTSTRYDTDMETEDHIRFLESIIKNKSKILVSGYDCELYDILTENGFNKHSFEVNTISGNFKKKVKVETIWKNY